MNANNKIYKIVTAKVIESLKNGKAPWRRTWATNGAGAHANLSTKKPYRGGNVFMLACSGFDSPWWLTFKQAKAMGGQVRKGESGTPLMFWNFIKKKDPVTGLVVDEFPMLRYFTVFNVEQIDGLEDKIPKVETKERSLFEQNADCDALVEAMPDRPRIDHGGDRACYAPRTDRVKMPEKDQFDESAAYYSTLFHELIHSTGHAKRVGRKGIEDFDGFGSQQYSKEELIAEMGAAFLCGITGIDNDRTIENTGAYLRNWAEKLEDDPKLFAQAGSAAQKAVDFMTVKEEVAA
jgi:antirestriction protein ArdC